MITHESPARLVIYHVHPNGEWEFEDDTVLPAGADPSFIDWDWDGHLVIGDDANEEYLYYDDETGELVDHEPYGIGTQLASTGFVQAFQGDVTSDFGDGFSAGGLWYGPGFGMHLPLADTQTPNGIDLVPDPSHSLKIMEADASRAKSVGSVLLVIDANQQQDHQGPRRRHPERARDVAGSSGGLGDKAAA